MGKKIQNMMYMQFLNHLPEGINNLVDMMTRIEETVSPEKMAGILHDKDFNEMGELENPHIHIFMHFENSRSLNNVAKLIGDQPQYISYKKGCKAIYGFAYLIHATPKSKHKYQYPVADVKSNFDYNELIKRFERLKANKKEKNSIKNLLECIVTGKKTAEDVISDLDTWTYSKFKRQIQDAESRRLKIEALNWRKKMRDNNTKTTVVWMYGKAGTGKSSLAYYLASKHNEPIFISGSSRDIFQNYHGEHIAIIDDFRDHSGGIEYSDLLRILDPYNIAETTMGPSRYSDKELMLEYIYITCPYSPKEFYDSYFPNSGFSQTNNKDSFDQLLRRIDLVICMTQKSIYRADYIMDRYIPDKSSAKDNSYSAIARLNTMTYDSGLNLYDEILSTISNE